MPHDGGVSTRWVLLTVMLVSGVLAVSVPATIRTVQEFREYRAEEASEPTTMLAVAPGGFVELADLSADHAQLYEAAASHRGLRADCLLLRRATFLEHADLLRCFVRPQDGAWEERHATGCVVCLAEARQVLEGIARGDGVGRIEAGIDDRFGGHPGLTQRRLRVQLITHRRHWSFLVLAVAALGFTLISADDHGETVLALTLPNPMGGRGDPGPGDRGGTAASGAASSWRTRGWRWVKSPLAVTVVPRWIVRDTGGSGQSSPATTARARGLASGTGVRRRADDRAPSGARPARRRHTHARFPAPDAPVDGRAPRPVPPPPGGGERRDGVLQVTGDFSASA